jgi:hypothetical protein
MKREQTNNRASRAKKIRGKPDAENPIAGLRTSVRMSGKMRIFQRDKFKASRLRR